MRSLFAKILLWFVLAIVATVLVTTITSIVSYKKTSTLRAPFSLLIALEAREARYAWETGGRDALAATLRRFQDVTGARKVIFTDAQGTDLASGDSRRDLIRAAQRHASFPFRDGGGFAFSRYSSDGRYCFFLVVSPMRLLFSNFQPAHLLVILVVVGLCYGLTYYLTLPLRGLQRALEKFGRGDLDARAPASRGDELGDLARTFNKMAQQIQMLVAARHRLLLDISHELRSPLARLSVAVELARSGEPGALPLDRIQREADRLNELIGQMLEVARLENNPAQRKLQPVDLNRLIAVLVDDCSVEAAARGCALRFEMPAQLSIEGDSELLRRAIENVVRNAIRYAPPQSCVEVALENSGGRASVKVRDYGPGVPEDALGQIFDPFFRVEADRSRSRGGVGLGLSIARRAIELHHGNLRASNAAPGLLVEIELPA